MLLTLNVSSNSGTSALIIAAVVSHVVAVVEVGRLARRATAAQSTVGAVGPELRAARASVRNPIGPVQIGAAEVSVTAETRRTVKSTHETRRPQSEADGPKALTQGLGPVSWSQ